MLPGEQQHMVQPAYWAQVSPVEYREVELFYPGTGHKIRCTYDYITRSNRDNFLTFARNLYVLKGVR